MMWISQWGADCIEELISISHYLKRKVQGEMITSVAHFAQNNGSVCTSVHLLLEMNEADIRYCLRLL